MEHKIYHMTAFLKEAHGGNYAGVVINADSLSDVEMQSIAKGLGYSETAFVLTSDKADFKVRFFTPNTEVDLCGHATIATFNLLRDLKIISEGFYTQVTKVGILKLEVKTDIVYMEQVPPIYGEYIDPLEIEDCFKSNNFINTSLPIRVLSTGMREIFVPLKSIKMLNELVYNIKEIIKLSLKYKVIGIHCFALSEKKGVDAFGRNFAPIVGINEESATGTSNGALGCYLNKYIDNNKTTFILRQGYNMNKPSEIITKITIENNEIITVFVGGSARNIKEWLYENSDYNCWKRSIDR